MLIRRGISSTYFPDTEIYLVSQLRRHPLWQSTRKSGDRQKLLHSPSKSHLLSFDMKFRPGLRLVGNPRRRKSNLQAEDSDSSSSSRSHAAETEPPGSIRLDEISSGGTSCHETLADNETLPLEITDGLVEMLTIDEPREESGHASGYNSHHSQEPTFHHARYTSTASSSSTAIDPEEIPSNPPRNQPVPTPQIVRYTWEDLQQVLGSLSRLPLDPEVRTVEINLGSDSDSTASVSNANATCGGDYSDDDDDDDDDDSGGGSSVFGSEANPRHAGEYSEEDRPEDLHVATSRSRLSSRSRYIPRPVSWRWLTECFH
jgi:hypothetical protein